ncbi:T9SS C-terminal target domain-containing protein [Dokdonia sinensis]|uniref:T9SS C-terminal target domain-containing protein n=1 Tax=Dokdonia sinensis TaxID=2479847 RepID=A0A3M0G1T1_9FLAO|nr:fibronectin type III domain-containing protein [Dokdonia sinensis]RMB56132.1 T9SS C-terminal target domain-containing protein [Dokdonia sinensis]
MKKITLLMALIVSAFALQVSAQNPVFEGDGGFINDNNCGFGFDEFDAEVTGIGVIGDTQQIDEIRLNISHTWSSDLNIFLQAPDGETTIELSTGNGGLATDAYTETIFSDEGNPPTIGGPAPFTGVFAPEGGSLNEAFAGVEGSGDWTLLVCDSANFDTGTVDQWSIRFQDNPEPCPAPFNVTVSNVMSTSFDISWQGTSGADAYQYVVMNDGDAPEFANPPAVEADQTTDLMETVVALLPATDYDVYVRSVCNGTPGPWTAVVDVTTEDVCPAPTDLSVEEVDNDSIAFSWTAANNSDSYDYAVVPTGDAPTYSAADAAFGNVTGTSATATGLDEQTTYDVYVRNNCGATDGNSVDLGPQSATTGCDNIVLNAGDVYTEDFADAFNTGNDPECFTQNGMNYVYTYEEAQLNGGDFGTGTASTEVVDNDGVFGAAGGYALVDPIQPAVIFGTNDGTNAQMTNLDSPNFDISDVEGAAVRFALNNNVDEFFSSNFGVTNNTMNVQVSTDNGETFTTVLTSDSNTATSDGNEENWENYTLDIDGLGLGGGTIKVRFETILDGVFNFVGQIAIDSFEVSELGCADPENVMLSNLEPNSADVSFSGFSTAVNGHFYALVEPGVDPEVGPYIQSGSLDAGVETFALTTLEPRTCYELYVRAICDGETSGFSDAFEFCAPALCDAPDDVEVDNVTNNSVDVSWDAVDGVVSYDYLLTAPGGDPEVAADVIAGTAGNTTDTAVTISPIADGTSYVAWVRSVCDEDGNTSEYAASAMFMTNIGCNSDFFDTGGIAADYGNNERYTVTLFPSANASALTLEFTSVALEFGEDFLGVYNGVGTAQPFTLDLRAPATFTSTDSTGAITVSFDSDGSGTDSGWEAFTTCSLINDVCSTSIELTADEDFETSAVEVTSTGAVTSNGGADPSCGFFSGNGDGVWYTVEVPESTNITIETQETVTGNDPILDTGLAVYTGSCGSLTEVGCDDDNGIGSYSKVELTGLTAGETLYIRVFGSDSAGLTGDFRLAAYDASLNVSDLAAAGFNFYPNPVDNVLNLSAQEKIQTVEVFNLLGQTVTKSSPDALNTTVDMSNLNTGVYLVNVTINNQTGAYRIIKQ